MAPRSQALAVRAERHAHGPHAAWPLRANSSLPVALSQIFTVWSLLPEARRWPSGLNATLMDQTGMALEGEQLLAGRAVPDLHRLVIAPRSQALAVRAERHAHDPTGMALEGEQLLAGRAVPDLHRLVIARRSQALAVRAERHARDPTGMALEGEQLLAGRAVPDLHRLVLLPEARRWPSGLNATLVTQPPWPLRANSSLPVALSQIFTVCPRSPTPGAGRPG